MHLGPGGANSNDLIQRVVAHTRHKGLLGGHLVRSFRSWDLLDAFRVPSGGLGPPHGPLLIALGFRLASANPIQVEIWEPQGSPRAPPGLPKGVLGAPRAPQRVPREGPNMEPAGTRSGSHTVWWVGSTRLLRFTTWNPLEPAGTRGGTRTVWWVRSTRLVRFYIMEPAGTRGGTRAFSRTLYAEIQFHVSPRDLFILLN